MNIFNKWNLPAIVWGLVILILTSIPTLATPDLGINFEDKIGHLGVYFIFELLLMRAFVKGDIQLLNKGRIAAVLCATAFAALDEIHQLFIPGRSGDVFDFFADVIGILLALFTFRMLNRVVLKWH